MAFAVSQELMRALLIQVSSPFAHLVSPPSKGETDSSANWKAMPGFPDARRDNGIATTLKVSQVPAVYLAQPFTGKITPIGFGVLSEAQLLERIAIVSAQPTESVSSNASRQAVLQ